MKTKFILLAFCVLLISESSYSQSDGFGLGLILDEPTGVSAKLWLGSNNAMNFALDWSIAESSSIHSHADYVIHNDSTLEVLGDRVASLHKTLLTLREPGTSLS